MSARTILLQLLGNKCEKCGSTKALHIHHKDENRENNDLKNIQLFCASCHKNEHPKKSSLTGMKNFTQSVSDDMCDWLEARAKEYSWNKKQDLVRQILREYRQKVEHQKILREYEKKENEKIAS